MAPFRAIATPLADMVGPMPYPAMYKLTGEGEHPGPGVVRSRSTLDPRTSARSTRSSSATRTPEPAPAAMTQIRVLGGAMGRVPAGATAFAHRDASS